MFTGIVEEIGIVKSLTKNGTQAVIAIECNKVLLDTKLGDSIAINGVCQTAVEINANSFSVEVSSATLEVTTFKTLKVGDKVNLERALTLQSRLGGHLVSGHVDGVAKVKNIQKDANFYNLSFELDKNLMKYIAKKGSITINGISLTIAELTSSEVKIAIIPHTFENTTLKNLKYNDFVNVETDILAKYVEKFLSTNNNSVIDEDFLKGNGFF